VGEFECSVGVEWRAADNIAHLSVEAARLAEAAALLADHVYAVNLVERAVASLWPGRAYFVETERDGAGVQVFQPYGLPRNA